ncbi:molybdopterin-dependent oxidoreductase [Aurantiacibacter gangjinensis]|uniref:Molybdopterin-binding protein n=1 Tax=Aurantiacibacter gangjinensis TaxID=502682 RepID=A0A0G9MPH8_9SPHN|nr:molybdopterin-dependent oxidoreductase [Aurantiacibacter gangjinensis]APE28384.1 Sulfite oxidase [Aurantiacibacter gangjinensis]KLE32612.1 molybdopterin-binding protein [Aurantiacibacter gangjinensis]
MQRRNFLVAAGAAFLAGCNEIGNSRWFGKIVDGAQSWHRGLHRGLAFGRIPMAPEYNRADISPFFRGNGSQDVDTDAYRSAEAEGFANWQFTVTGMVDNELSLSMDQLRALPQRTQITRHDCVEGWSAIGEWTGPQLSDILDAAGVRKGANYVIFRCADNLNGQDYYESCDMDDAYHPQTIIAHELNGEPLPVRNGAPLRLRIERQLGYKHAKYLTGIELVADYRDIAGGEGGYWEDRSGYQWYAGI